MLSGRFVAGTSHSSSDQQHEMMLCMLGQGQGIYGPRFAVWDAETGIKVQELKITNMPMNGFHTYMQLVCSPCGSKLAHAVGHFDLGAEQDDADLRWKLCIAKW